MNNKLSDKKKKKHGGNGLLISTIITFTAVFLFAVVFIILILKDTSPPSNVIPGSSVIEEPEPVPQETPAVITTTPPVTIPIFPEPVTETSEAQVFTKPEYIFPDDFATELLSSDYYLPCKEGGTVQHISYDAVDYLTGEPIKKIMDVYVPYAYSKENQYNVLILSPGAGQSQDVWFQEREGADGIPISTRNLLDNMIYYGKCAPLIVASVTVVNSVSCNGKAFDVPQLETDGDQLAAELVQDILPCLVSTYSTYSAGTSPEELMAARDHFAYGGLSWGALMGYYRILPVDLEYFGWFGIFATNGLRVTNIIKVVKEKIDSYPLDYLIGTCGTSDPYFDAAKDVQNKLEDGCPGIDSGVNSSFIAINLGTHGFGTWEASLYNCLIAFF